MTYRVLDLFSGIGGFSLGLERTGGFETVAFCEIDKFCQRVLRKHWPDVPIYEDVRTLTAERLRADGISVDVICGGFPCQDISTAGRGAGIEGERSGLWSEYARIIGELRPSYVIVENVAALLGRGLDKVLGDLAALGLDAEWHCIPASAVGAPHRRDRLWIIANASEVRFDAWWAKQSLQGLGLDGEAPVAHANSKSARGLSIRTPQANPRLSISGKTLADTDSQRKLQPQGCESDKRRRIGDGSSYVPDATSKRYSGQGQHVLAGRQAPRIDRQTVDAFAERVHGIWSSEPNVGRVAHGVPARMDRLASLGNAVVPQIPELIGRAILEAGTRP